RHRESAAKRTVNRQQPSCHAESGNVKKFSRSQFNHAPIIERSRRSAGKHQANMFNIAPRRAHTGADVLAPFPARLICGATNCHAAEMHKLEPAFLHHANFVRRLEAFEKNRNLLAPHPRLNNLYDKKSPATPGEGSFRGIDNTRLPWVRQTVVNTKD